MESFNLEKIVNTVCDMYDCIPEQIHINQHTTGNVNSAKRVIYKAISLCGYSSGKIGKMLHKERHSIISILLRITKEEELVAEKIAAEFNGNFRKLCQKIKDMLNAGYNEEEIRMEFGDEKVDKAFEYISKFCQKKKIPDYKHSTVYEKYI